uniref:LIM zinc-binding domain-containing protein n=1 Tax=Ditylenchus dipsaci TaxID=166011 RepID=A0A915DB23_9BILA
MLISACRTALKSSNVFSSCNNNNTSSSNPTIKNSIATSEDSNSSADQHFYKDSTTKSSNNSGPEIYSAFHSTQNGSTPINISTKSAFQPNNTGQRSSWPILFDLSSVGSSKGDLQPAQRTPLMALGQVVEAIDQDTKNNTSMSAACKNSGLPGTSAISANILQQPKAEERSAEERENNTICQSCSRPIKEAFLLKISNHFFHEDCAVCSICGIGLKNNNSNTGTGKCYERKGKLFCKMHYYNDFSPYQCSGCLLGITPSDLVYKLKQGIVYHVQCHRCFQCGRQLAAGEQILVDENLKTVSCVSHSSSMPLSNNCTQMISNHGSSTTSDSLAASLPQPSKETVAQDMLFPNPLFHGSFPFPTSSTAQQPSYSLMHTNHDLFSASLLTAVASASAPTESLISANRSSQQSGGTVDLLAGIANSQSSSQAQMTQLGFSINDNDLANRLLHDQTNSSSLNLSLETQNDQQTQNFLAAAAAAGFGDLSSSFTSNASTASILDCSPTNNFSTTNLLNQTTMDFNLASAFANTPSQLQLQQQSADNFNVLSPLDSCLTFDSNGDDKPAALPSAAKVKRKEKKLLQMQVQRPMA